MRRLYMIAIAVVVIAIVVVAAVFVGIPYYERQLELQKERETLIIGTTETLESLSTFKPKTGVAWDYALNPAIYDTLLRHKIVGSATDLQPWLAESYTQIDPVTWEFKLREDVKFHDGTPFNASCVEYTLGRYIHGEGSTKTPQMKGGGLNSSTQIEIVDNYTIIFHLNFPYSDFPLLMSSSLLGVIASPTAAEAMSEEEFGISPVGAGMWKVESFDMGEELTLERNDDYWNKDWIPKFKKVIIKYFSEASTLKFAIEDGTIDMAYRTIDPMDVPSLKANPDIITFEQDESYLKHIVMPHNIPPTDNTVSGDLVRKAIAYSIDYEKIISVALKDEASPVQSMTHPVLWPDWYTPAYEKYWTRDVDKAKELLTEAGYPDGVDVTLWYTPVRYGATEVDVCVVIKDSCAEAGIDVEIKSAEWATYLDYIFKGSANHMFLLQLTPSWGYVPYCYLSYYTPGQLLWNPLNMSLDPPFDQYDPEALFLTVSTSMSDSERKAALTDLQEYVADYLPVIPISVPKQYLFTRKNVKDMTFSVNRFTLMDSVAQASKE